MTCAAVAGDSLPTATSPPQDLPVVTWQEETRSESPGDFEPNRSAAMSDGRQARARQVVTNTLTFLRGNDSIDKLCSWPGVGRQLLPRYKHRQHHSNSSPTLTADRPVEGCSILAVIVVFASTSLLLLREERRLSSAITSCRILLANSSRCPFSPTPRARRSSGGVVGLLQVVQTHTTSTLTAR